MAYKDKTKRSVNYMLYNRRVRLKALLSLAETQSTVMDRGKLIPIADAINRLLARIEELKTKRGGKNNRPQPEDPGYNGREGRQQ